MVPPCPFFEVADALEDDILVPGGASQYYNKSILKTVVKTLHPSRQPPTTLRSFQDFSNFVIQSICERIRHLAQPDLDVRSYIQCFDPSYKPIAHQTRRDLIVSCLRCEYSSELVTYLFTDPNQQYKMQKSQQLKMHIDDLFHASQEFWSDVENHWPTVPTLQTNLKCMQNYFNGSQWSYSSVCSVCSRKWNCSVFLTETVSPSQEDSKITMEHLEILQCQDRRIRTNFEFSENEDLNGLMLTPEGINRDGSIEVCGDCISKLQQSEIPKFALKNDLYRGRVPDEFSDLTWIEEMVCCVYRTTAHVI
jgi:hypothetical protein